MDFIDSLYYSSLLIKQSHWIAIENVTKGEHLNCIVITANFQQNKNTILIFTLRFPVFLLSRHQSGNNPIYYFFRLVECFQRFSSETNSERTSHTAHRTNSLSKRRRTMDWQPHESLSITKNIRLTAAALRLKMWFVHAIISNFQFFAALFLYWINVGTFLCALCI